MLKKYSTSTHPLALVMGGFQFLSSFANILRDKVSSYFWRYNVARIGKGTFIQHSVLIRHPKNVQIGNGVNIGRRVAIHSEFPDSHLHIGDYSQVNVGVDIDYTGGISIGNSVVISADTKIYTHSHGYDPKSKAIRKPLVIEDDVWIGANSMILENVERIGRGAMIGAGSVVTKNVEPNAVVGGNPARVIRLKN